MNAKRKQVEESLYARMQLFAVPSRAQVDASRERIRRRLDLLGRMAPDKALTDVSHARGRTIFRWRLLAATATALLAILLPAKLIHDRTSLANVERVGGSLYRISEKAQAVLVLGDAIKAGQSIRAVGGAAILRLTDNSQIEMRAESELSFEQARDGLRIRLSEGDVIVTAARQRTGHLYLQTKDVIVSVVGTVFLVKAQEQGSRVVVIQGEVQVQQGATLKKLLPGQQVVSSEHVASSVLEEIAWSQSAAAHLASLQQSVFTPAVTQDAFDEASIRRSKGPENGGGGRCGNVQIDSGRFVTSKTSLYTLIAFAYGKNCLLLNAIDFITGGPGWIRSERFDIQALIPEGSLTYTPRQLLNAEAPKLQAMLKGLLAERFKLLLHRDLKEMPIFELTLAKDGPKLTTPKDSDGKAVRWQPQPDQNGKLADKIEGRKASMTDLANMLTLATRQPVVDRTGIVGEFNFDVEFAGAPTAAGPSLFTALEELGLQLKSAKGPVEVLVVDQAERPSGN